MDKTGFALGLAGVPVGLAVVIAAAGMDWSPHWPGVSYLLVGVVVAPIIEEIVFRGGLQSWLRDRTMGRRAIGPLSLANLVTSLVFAGLHVIIRGDPSATLVFFPSLLLGWVYDRREALVPVIGLHGLYNLAWLCLLARG